MPRMFYQLPEVTERLRKTEEEIKELVKEGRLREFRDNSTLFFKVYCLRLSFPVFKRPEPESFPSAAFAIPEDISFVFGKNFGTPA